MNPTCKKSVSSHRFLALAATALLHTASSHGAAIAPNTPFNPGVTLAPGTTIGINGTLAGTVRADKIVPFADTMGLYFNGTIRSLVVERTDTSKLDFYFQIINTTASELFAGDADIFAVAIENFSGYGFAGDSLDAIYRLDGLSGLAGAPASVNGTVAPFIGYREALTGGSIGFQFANDPVGFIDNPTNLHIGQASNFLIVRTNATQFADAPALVMGTYGTAVTQGYSPVPEPTVAGLTAIGALGLGLRRRRTV